MSMPQIGHETWAPWTRAGDKALATLHASWGLTLSVFFEGVQEALQRSVFAPWLL
jgi:hypothetical protein